MRAFTWHKNRSQFTQNKDMYIYIYIYTYITKVYSILGLDAHRILQIPREIDFLLLLLIQPRSDCIYQFPIDLTPNEIPFGIKSIGK